MWANASSVSTSVERGPDRGERERVAGEGAADPATSPSEPVTQVGTRSATAAVMP